MADRDRDEPRSEASPPDAKDGNPGGRLQPRHDANEAASDQAIRNQDRALESGEENVV